MKYEARHIAPPDNKQYTVLMRPQPKKTELSFERHTSTSGNRRLLKGRSMFYPAEALRRGGRFYLCWMADSYPQRFRALPRRQLWGAAGDLRQLCDDLLEVIQTEPGVPNNRFSLRLSSQLTRGIIRLFERKTNTFLEELCMLKATIDNTINKKYEVSIVKEKKPRGNMEPPPPGEAAAQQPMEEIQEQEVLDKFQEGGNEVARVSDITMREVAIPPREEINDNFGYENPDQALQHMLTDVEAMLGAEPAPPRHLSGLMDISHNPLLDVTDKSRDMSRLALDQQMERISEIDASIIHNAILDVEIPAVKDLAKDVAIPEIPEIQVAPAHEEKTAEEPIPLQTSTPAPPRDARRTTNITLAAIEPLEELEQSVPARRPPRRIRRILKSDTTIKINKHEMLSRIGDLYVDTRTVEENRIKIVKEGALTERNMFQRPSHAWPSRPHYKHTSYYARNLAPVTSSPYRREEISSTHPAVLAGAENIQDVTTEPQPAQDHVDLSKLVEVPIEQVELSPIRVPLDKTVDILAGELELIQIEDLQVKDMEKRRSTEDASDVPPKRRRSKLSSNKYYEAGNITFVSPEKTVPLSEPLLMHAEINAIPSITVEAHSAATTELPQEVTQEDVTILLQEAGLQEKRPSPEIQRRASILRTSDNDAESMTGSLDRTKVSLGEYLTDTEEIKLMKNEWGLEGTMMKIIQCIKEGIQPLTLKKLIRLGPRTGDTKPAAYCFSSIVKLKSAGFLVIEKDVSGKTLNNILDIKLGPKLQITM